MCQKGPFRQYLKKVNSKPFFRQYLKNIPEKHDWCDLGVKFVVVVFQWSPFNYQNTCKQYLKTPFAKKKKLKNAPTTPTPILRAFTFFMVVKPNIQYSTTF